MKHYIDPKIDCVFKAILGALGREHLLVHFLNAVVHFDSPIVSVTIENPYIERLQLDDKINIVDIKGRDQQGRTYQIEMQLTSPVHLISRMAQNLSQLHGQQLKKGDNFIQTKEAISIWLLTNDIGLQHYPNVAQSTYKFHFQMYEKELDINLPQSTHLHVIQLNRWRKPKKSAMQSLDYWIYFFMKANSWKYLPQDASIPEIKEAMTVLEEFANDPEKYEYYRARHNIQLVEQSVESENRQIREDYAKVVGQLDNAVAQLDSAFIKNHQLKIKLAKTLLKTNSMTIEQVADSAELSIDDVKKLIE